jgi:hypothetical protein
MPRQINARIDALFVEGPDDGAVVNAFVKKLTGIDMATPRLVRTNDGGGGDSWALHQFDAYIREITEGARVGVIVDRDGPERDKWPAVQERLRSLGGVADGPIATGAIVDGRYGIWMWPDNVSHGDLENFVASIVPPSPLLTYSTEVCGIAKETHGAEYDLVHSRKAALKVRSVWRDASAAGGYGHLVRNLALTETPASAAFLAWFKELFLT